MTNSRNTCDLYTAGQIQDMAVGNPALSENGTFALNYNIQQSNDLVNWKRVQASLLPPTSLPTDKAFVRIRAQSKKLQEASPVLQGVTNPGYSIHPVRLPITGA